MFDFDELDEAEAQSDQRAAKGGTVVASAQLDACRPISTSKAPVADFAQLDASRPVSVPEVSVVDSAQPDAGIRPVSPSETQAFPPYPHAAIGQQYETVGKVLMRGKEDLESPKLGFIPPSTRLEILEVGWGRRVRVLEEHGVEGWVSLAKACGEPLLRLIRPSAAWLDDAKLAKVKLKAASSTSCVCDKCDGPHATNACPFFKNSREEHKDAWANYGNKDPLSMGGNGGNFILRNARVVQQPGDGSCLFHSLVCGLSGSSAHDLRHELMDFLERNPKLELAGNTLEEWVKWDANCSVSEYARRMSFGGWGGGIEMACCSLLKKINVHVYEQATGREFKRISCFDAPSARKTIHVLYQGRMHYDALAI